MVHLSWVHLRHDFEITGCVKTKKLARYGPARNQKNGFRVKLEAAGRQFP